MDTNTFLVILAALAGGVATATLGWLEAKTAEAFALRKFGMSVIRSGIAAAALALAAPTISPVLAFLIGAGADTLGKTGQAVLTKK